MINLNNPMTVPGILQGNSITEPYVEHRILDKINPGTYVKAHKGKHIDQLKNEAFCCLTVAFFAVWSCCFFYS
jgi:hypothetical protein